MVEIVIPKPKLDFLEVMIVNVCNLSCRGCTTFSDLTHSGYVTWEQGRSWLEPWANRIDIQAVGLMGGEPLINPELRNWLIGIREMLPHAQIRFVTNGLLLDRHWWVVDQLDQLGNAVLKISQHVDDPAITTVVERIQQSRLWSPINELGIDRWVSPTGFRFQLTRPTHFIQTFRNTYQDMHPHNSKPADAFKICVQKRCPLLINGKIWKCGTAALTPDILKRFGYPNQAEWEPYITPGLTSDCTNNELEQFVKNFGQPHAICRQCPSENDIASRFDHFSNVSFSKLK